MANYHGSPPSGTCNTDLSVENKKHKENSPEHRTFEEPGGGWDGTNKRQKAAKLLRANHEGRTTWR